MTHQGHLELQHRLGGPPGNLFLGTAQELAKKQDCLGGAFVDDFAASGPQQFAIGRVMVASELDEYVFVDFDLSCDSTPGLTAGAEFGGTP